MAKTQRCKGKTDSGDPCGTPPRLVGSDGYCPAHRPGGRDEMSRRGKKGGYVSTSPRRGHGMQLPPLDNLDAARTWAEETARALAEDRISAKKANGINRLLKSWMSAYSEGESMEAERLARSAADRGVFGPRAEDGDG